MPQPKAFEVRETEATDRPAQVAERVAPLVTVGGRVRSGPDADSIEDDQRGTAQLTASPG